MGRPVEWTEDRKKEKQNYICVQIALGRSLVKICQEPDMPSYSTVMEWRVEDEAFAENYARAREDQADFYAEEVIDIADTEPDPNVARVRIDARKWKAGKMKPKVYGERIIHDGDVGLKVSDDQLKSRVAHLIGKAGADLASRRDGPPEEAA